MSLPRNRLLPCPFCGGEATLEERAGWYTVGCVACGVETSLRETKRGVRRVWNRRHVPNRNRRDNVTAPGNRL